jgi:hypothetical protein
MAINIDKFVKDITKEINKTFWEKLNQSNIVGVVRNVILAGISPVKGAGSRFQKYSKGYLNKISGKVEFTTKEGEKVRFNARSKNIPSDKKKSPVNLKLSGEMLKSLRFNKKNGEMYFKDEKAYWHNDGEGSLPVRRLIPDKDGEEFSRLIQNKIADDLSSVLGKSLRKSKNFIKINISFK